MNAVSSDRSREKVDLTQFIDRFNAPLSLAYRRLGATIRKSTGLPLAVPQPDLHPHTHDVVSRGHEKYSDHVGGLGTYFDSLHLNHIKWAGAVLRHDEASAVAFLNTIRDKVAPAIVSKFRHQEFAETAVADLPSRILMAGQSDRPRIAEYLGRSCLETWLVGIGYNLAINERRRPAAMGGVTSVIPDPPAPALSTEETERREQLEIIRQVLFKSAAEAAGQMSAQEQLVFQMAVIRRLRPSQIADCLSVCRARIAQIRKKIGQRIMARMMETTADFSDTYGASPEVIQKFLWKILGVPDSTDEDSDGP